MSDQPQESVAGEEVLADDPGVPDDPAGPDVPAELVGTEPPDVPSGPEVDQPAGTEGVEGADAGSGEPGADQGKPD